MTENDSTKTGTFMGWIDKRYPWTPFWKKHLSEYYAPKNFNFWYYLWLIFFACVRYADCDGHLVGDGIYPHR